jgi:ketosteroid isomerase-like protein
MNASPIALTLWAGLSLAACAAKPPPPAVDAARVVDAIKTGEVHWNMDWKSGDAGKVTAHYAPTATVMLAGAPVMNGAAAIRAGVQQAIDDPAFSLTFASDKVDVAKSGDLAASRGAYKMTQTDPATKAASTVTGTFVTVYKPGPDGQWKAVWDITTPGRGGDASRPAP